MDETVQHCAAMMDGMHGPHGGPEGDWAAGWMMGMGGMGGMGMLAFTLVWLLIIAAVAALLIFGGVWLWRRRQPGTGTAVPSPREALDRRYAAGELDRETYLPARADLEAPA